MTTTRHPWVETARASRIVADGLNELSNEQVGSMAVLVEFQPSMLHALIRDNREARTFKKRFEL